MKENHNFFAGGIVVSNCRFDESQDLQADHFPIIMEAMSHSEWELAQWAGTPKTPENTLTGLWLSSSMAEWFTPCRACNHWNIASTDHDLERMIGPYWEPGAQERFLGLVCSKCARRIDPADGRWVHRHPDKQWDFAGYHIPQPIMHIHYSRPDKWASLLAKREGSNNYTPVMYSNEVLGEPSGQGSQLVTLDDLRAAATLPWPNTPRAIPDDLVARAGAYQHRVLAIDWGGGGKQRARGSGDQISLTSMAVLGWTADGKIDVIWGRRLYTPHNHILEAKECLAVYKRFRCDLVAHDYTGAGAIRETLLSQSGIPLKRIIAIAYVRAAAAAVMRHHPATVDHPRSHYKVDKTRSLLYTCTAIKRRLIRFFGFDYVSSENPGLIHDFLGLIEEKVATRHGSDIYTISKHASMTDDFAQAVNIGACCLWHIAKQWPTISDPRDQPLTEAQADAVEDRGRWAEDT